MTSAAPRIYNETNLINKARERRWTRLPRPRKERLIAEMPPINCFKPAGVRLCDLEEVVLTLEEWEALRLNDRDGIEQVEAAALMGVSKPTFHRIITEARRKVAEALTRGKAIRIEGGNFRLVERMRRFACRDCGHRFEVPHGTGQRGIDMDCPACGGHNVHRDEEGGCGPGRRPWGRKRSGP